MKCYEMIFDLPYSSLGDWYYEIDRLSYLNEQLDSLNEDYGLCLDE